MILQLKGGVIYLWGRASQLEGVFDGVQCNIIGIGQVEQLSNPGLDFHLVERLLPGPRRISASLVLEAGVNPFLAGLDSSADEVADNARAIKPSPWDHPEQFGDLLQVLGPLRPAAFLLWNQSHIAQSDGVRLFTDVEPFLVPLVQGGVPGAVQVLSLHAVTQVQVNATGDLRATAPFLPKTE